MYTIVYTVYDDYGLDTQQIVSKKIINCPHFKAFNSEYKKILADLYKGGYSWHENIMV